MIIVKKSTAYKTLVYLFFSFTIIGTSHSKPRYFLTSDHKVHKMGSQWDVCQYTGRCWKFKKEFRDEMLEGLNKNPDKFNSSSFHSSTLDISSDAWGNRTLYDDVGDVLAYAKYGEEFGEYEGFDPKYLHKGYDKHDCDENGIYQGGRLDKVVNVGKKNVRNVPDKYKWISEQVVMIRNTNKKSVFDTSGFVMGDNCNVLLGNSHTYRDHENKGMYRIKKKDKFYAVQNMKNPSRSFAVVDQSTLITGWDDDAGKERFNKDPRGDWAIAMLKNNIFHKKKINKKCKNIPRHEGECNGKLFMISFQQGDYYNKKYSSDKDCKAYRYTDKEATGYFNKGDDDNVEIFKHGCDTSPIASAGIIFCDTAGEVSIYGLNDGHSSNYDVTLQQSDKAPSILLGPTRVDGKLKVHYNRGLKITGRLRDLLNDYLLESKQD